MAQNKYLLEVYLSHKKIIDNFQVFTWSDYIPGDIAADWSVLSKEVKAAVFLCCNKRVNDEEMGLINTQ